MTYRLDIVTRYKADEEFVGVGGLELGLPPFGVVVLEEVEDIVLLDGQLLFSVGVVVIQCHADLEERHGSVGGRWEMRRDVKCGESACECNVGEWRE